MSEKQEQPGGLLSSVVRGGKWLFLFQIAVNVLLMVRSMLLMRLLTREDWGLWAAVAATVQLMRNLSEAGFDIVAVQRREGDSPEVLMTTWWLNTFRGVLMSVALFAAAPMVSVFFPEAGEGLPELMRLASAVLLMEGLVSVGVVRAHRRLAFNRMVLVQQGSAIVSVFLAIVLGFMWRNVMALVVAEITRAALLLVLSYLILPIKPSLQGSLAMARKLWAQSKHLYLTNLFEFLIMRGDVFVVLRVLGGVALASYNLAYAFGTMASVTVTSVMGRVLFPAFVKLRDDAERLKQAFLRSERFLTVLLAPMALGGLALAPALAVFGGRTPGDPTGPLKWGAMVFPLQVFSIGVYLACLVSINVLLMLGFGRTDRIKTLRLAHLGLVALAVYPLTWRWGINGTVMVTLLQLPVWVLSARFAREHINCSLIEQLKNQSFLAMPSAAMGLAILALWWLLKENMLAYTAGCLVLCPVVYIGLLYTRSRRQLMETVSILMHALGKDMPVATKEA